jgi:hypothetical protein
MAVTSALLFALAIAAGGCMGSPPSSSSGGAGANGACDESLWNHVYHPDRLQDPDTTKHHQCLAATGTVADIKSEADGDRHIRVTLDAGQEWMINQANTDSEHGDLVVEPICVGAVTQSDAVGACSNYTNQVSMPAKGSHVRVVGVWVHDVQSQHGWNELHPVTSIVAA